jgi:hypothetical protein
MSATIERLGQLAYQRYALERGQQAYDGSRIPEWVEVRPEIRAAWGEAAVAVGQLVANDQALLGELAGRDRVSRLIEIALDDVGRTDAETFRAGGPGSDWCAYWVSSVLERAGLPVPAPGERARRGARALVQWVAEHGEWVIDPTRAAKLVKVGSLAKWIGAASEIRPGDVIAWRASRIPGDWRGHVALVVGVHQSTLELVGGNESGQVRYTHQDVTAWPQRRPGGMEGIGRCARAY